VINIQEFSLDFRRTKTAARLSSKRNLRQVGPTIASSGQEVASRGDKVFLIRATHDDLESIVGYSMALAPAIPRPWDRERRAAGTMKPDGRSICGPARIDHMTDETEIVWHREQIAKNRAILAELKAGNTGGGDVFPETQSEIDHLEAQIAQSELIIAASEKA
jgi:hypothetical protein